MAFPIIQTQSQWTDWGNLGTGNWKMWFTAPYGSWVYLAYVKNSTVYYKKVDTGTTDYNYPIYTWEFDTAEEGEELPTDIFTHETTDGYPDGAMNCGCIRTYDGDPVLFLVGRASAAPTATNKLQYFPVGTGFASTTGYITLAHYGGSTPIDITRICGIEVVSKPSTPAVVSLVVVLNNRSSSEFQLLRWDISPSGGEAWDDGVKDATTSVNLSPQYIENNSLSRIRGIGHSSDGNILVFANTGATSTSCKVFKFNSTTLGYMGVTSWEPSLQGSTWAAIAQTAEVYMLFKGLDSSDVTKRVTAIYYDGSTGVPDASRSNFVISDNLTSFNASSPVALRYEALDGFNNPVVGINTKFIIEGLSEIASEWTDRNGAIRSTGSTPSDFFRSTGATGYEQNDPIGVSAYVNTNSEGIATAYYMPPRSGSGTAIEVIDVYCPASM